MPETVHIRLNPATRAHLERLAEARQTSLSDAVRFAVTEAAYPDGGVPDQDECLRLLGLAARAGSVPACRELLKHRRREASKPRSNTLRIVDEIAERRGGHGDDPDLHARDRREDSA